MDGSTANGDRISRAIQAINEIELDKLNYMPFLFCLFQMSLWKRRVQKHVRVLIVRDRLFIFHNTILYLRYLRPAFLQKESRRARCLLFWQMKMKNVIWNEVPRNSPDLAGTFSIWCPQPSIINRMFLPIMFPLTGLVLGGVRRGSSLARMSSLSTFYLRYYILDKDKNNHERLKLPFSKVLGSAWLSLQLNRTAQMDRQMSHWTANTNITSSKVLVVLIKYPRSMVNWLAVLMVCSCAIVSLNNLNINWMVSALLE